MRTRCRLPGLHPAALPHARILGLKTLGLNSRSTWETSEHLHLGDHKGKETKTMHWNWGKGIISLFLPTMKLCLLIPTISMPYCTAWTQDYAKPRGVWMAGWAAWPWHRRSLHINRDPGALVRKEAQACCPCSWIGKLLGPGVHDPGQLTKSAGILWHLFIKWKANGKKRMWWKIRKKNREGGESALKHYLTSAHFQTWEDWTCAVKHSPLF